MGSPKPTTMNATLSLASRAESFSNLAWKASQSRTALATNFLAFRVAREFLAAAEARGYLLNEIAPEIGGIVHNQSDRLFHFALSIVENETNG